MLYYNAWKQQLLVEDVFGVPKQYSNEKLLEVFFATHDPTTVNRQGSDVGTQYRSVIFYQNDVQKETTEKFIQRF